MRQEYLVDIAQLLLGLSSLNKTVTKEKCGRDDILRGSAVNLLRVR
jgi:hypothetical protein